MEHEAAVRFGFALVTESSKQPDASASEEVRHSVRLDMLTVPR